jgi:hypothetical protein
MVVSGRHAPARNGQYCRIVASLRYAKLASLLGRTASLEVFNGGFSASPQGQGRLVNCHGTNRATSFSEFARRQPRLRVYFATAQHPPTASAKFPVPFSGRFPVAGLSRLVQFSHLKDLRIGRYSAAMHPRLGGSRRLPCRFLERRRPRTDSAAIRRA